MLKCPATLKVGPLLFKVGRDNGDIDNFGSAHLVRKEIVFGSSLPDATQCLITLIHEWIHCYEEAFSVADSGKRLDHDHLRVISHAMVDLLQQLGLDAELDISDLPELRL